MRMATGWLACVLATTALMSPLAAGRSDSPNSATAALAEFLSASDPGPASYRGVRTIEAATRGGKMRARLTAWTSADPVAGFQYAVVEEEGAATIRRRVLRAALEAERTLRDPGERARGALTAANYDFTSLGENGDGLVQVQMHPKRRDTMLVDGTLLLTSAGDLVQIEGLLTKRPSVWTRRVEVVRHYARIAGVRVPISLESTAHILIVGTSTFSMRYDYESINGTAVSPEAVRRNAPGGLNMPAAAAFERAEP